MRCEEILLKLYEGEKIFVSIKSRCLDRLRYFRFVGFLVKEFLSICLLIVDYFSCFWVGKCKVSFVSII